MRRTCFLSAAVLALGLLLAGCGKSPESKLLDQLGAECNALVPGGIFRDAAIAFRGANLISAVNCYADLLPLAGNNQCAPASADAQLCQVFYYFYATDPGLCGPNGCGYVCEVRMEKAALDAANTSGDLGTASVCATRWYTRQP